MDAREPFPERLGEIIRACPEKRRDRHPAHEHEPVPPGDNTLMGIFNDANSQEFGFTPLSESDLNYF